MSTNVLKNKLTWVTSCSILLATSVPVRAFSVNLDTFTPVENTLGEASEVYENTASTATINETPITDGGFGNFFRDSSFLLLGATPDRTIEEDTHTVGVSAAVSNEIEVLSENADKDLDVKLDWTFRGNSDGILSGTDVDDLDNFSLVLAGANTLSQQNLAEVDTQLLFTTNYKEQRDYTITIPGGLSTGTYNIVATVVEPSIDNPIPLPSNDLTIARDTPLAAGTNDNSAAGIGDMNVTLSSDVTNASVPFEFSPTTGLFVVGSIWGLLRFKKGKKQKTAIVRSLYN